MRLVGSSTGTVCVDGSTPAGTCTDANAVYSDGRPPPTGLQNAGSARVCFVNAVVQCLVRTPEARGGHGPHPAVAVLGAGGAEPGSTYAELGALCTALLASQRIQWPCRPAAADARPLRLALAAQAAAVPAGGPGDAAAALEALLTAIAKESPGCGGCFPPAVWWLPVPGDGERDGEQAVHLTLQRLPRWQLPPVRLSVTVPPPAVDIATLKLALAAAIRPAGGTVGEAEDSFAIWSVADGRLWAELPDRSPLQQLRGDQVLLAVEQPPHMVAGDGPAFQLLPLAHRRPSAAAGPPELCGLPGVLALPKFPTTADVWDALATQLVQQRDVGLERGVPSPPAADAHAEPYDVRLLCGRYLIGAGEPVPRSAAPLALPKVGLVVVDWVAAEEARCTMSGEVIFMHPVPFL